MLGIWVQLEGLWMGLGPFTAWQMVDYPNKPTNYLGFPLCARALLRVAAGPATRPANSGSAGTEGAHTLSLSHFLASSSSPPFLLVLIFHCQLLLIPLPLGKVSLSTNRSWRAFVSTQFSLFCFRWRLFTSFIRRLFKEKCADGFVLIDLISLCCPPTGGSAVLTRGPTNVLCASRIYSRKTNKKRLVSTISSAMPYF